MGSQQHTKAALENLMKWQLSTQLGRIVAINTLPGAVKALPSTPSGFEGLQVQREMMLLLS